MAVVQHYQQTPKKKWRDREMPSAHAWNQFTREAGSMAEQEHIPLDRAQVKTLNPCSLTFFSHSSCVDVYLTTQYVYRLKFTLHTVANLNLLASRLV